MPSFTQCALQGGFRKQKCSCCASEELFFYNPILLPTFVVFNNNSSNLQDFFFFKLFIRCKVDNNQAWTSGQCGDSRSQ